MAELPSPSASIPSASRGRVIFASAASTLVAIAMNVLNEKYGTFIPDWLTLLVVYAAIALWFYAAWHSQRIQRIRALLYTKPNMLLLFIIGGAFVGGIAGAGLWLVNRNEQRLRVALEAETHESEAPASQPTAVNKATKRILLTPGSHPTPPGPPCTGDMETPLEVKKGEIAVFFGSSIVITKGTGVTILTIDQEPVLSFRRSVAEISLSAMIKGKVQGEGVRITDNLVTYDESLYEILHPDAQHLVVIDKRANGRLLSVNYLNQSAIVITGTFYGNRGPIHVTDSGIALPGNIYRTEDCFHNYEGPLFQY